MKKTMLILAAAALLIFGGYKIFGGKKAEAVAPVIETVKRGDLKLSIQSTGGVQPQNRLVVRPPLAGRIEQILVREGDYVKKGQILAWLSSTERAALLDTARAQGEEALAKWEQLYKATPLVAPMTGRIIARSVEPGQSVAGNEQVLVMSDRLIVLAQVDETDIGKVRLGQAVELSLDAYADAKIAARVDHIAFEARTVSNVTVYEVEVLPLKVPGYMKSGMTANVDFILEERKGVLLVAQEAVQKMGERNIVSVPDPEKPGAAKPRPLQLGITDGKDTEVLHGIKEGDQYYVQGSPLLLDPKKKEGSPLMMGRRPGSGTKTAGTAPRRSGGNAGPPRP